MTDLKTEFWQRMKSVRAGMLGIDGTDRLVPMSPNVDEDVPGYIWFITARGTVLAKATQSGARDARFVVSDDATGLYADVHGTLSASDDRKALDEVWSVIASAWFEDGKEDEDVFLMKFAPARAELSVTPTSGARFLFEIAKGNLTGQKPSAGENGTITF